MEKWVGETNIKHWPGVTAKINSLSSGVGWRQINKNHIILEILIQLVKEIFGHNIKMIDWLIDWLTDWLIEVNIHKTQTSVYLRQVHFGLYPLNNNYW